MVCVDGSYYSGGHELRALRVGDFAFVVNTSYLDYTLQNYQDEKHMIASTSYIGTMRC